MNKIPYVPMLTERTQQEQIDFIYYIKIKHELGITNINNKQLPMPKTAKQAWQLYYTLKNNPNHFDDEDIDFEYYTKLYKVYYAGKITDNNWRSELYDSNELCFESDAYYYKDLRQELNKREIKQDNVFYIGFYVVEDKHKCFHNELEDDEVFTRCNDQIDKADILFVYIDSLDCIMPKLISPNNIKADEYTRIANEYLRANIKEILEENNLVKAKANVATRQKILMIGGVKILPKYVKTLYMNKDFIG